MLRKSLSISKRVMIIISGVTAVTLLAGFIILLFSYVQSLKENLTTTSLQNATLIGQYTAVPLLFEDKAAIEKSLSSLVSVPSLQKVIVYDNKGSLFATHQIDSSLDIPEIKFHREYTEYKGIFLHVFRPIESQGKVLGTIYLIISTDALDKEIRDSINSILLLLLFLFSVTLVLAYFFQKSLTQPIINLAHVMDWVTHNDDYSVRVEKSVDDEIGTLYTDFNSMLERIESSNKNLIESSEKFSAVVKNSNDGIIILRDGLIQYANPAATLFTGFNEKEIVNKKIIDYVDKNDKKLVNELLHSKREKENKIHQIIIKRKDNTSIPVEINATNIEYLSQKSTMVFLRDITQRKKAESEKEKLEEQIRRAQKMETIGRLAGGIAHDFNNILTPIIGYANMAISNMAKNEKYVSYFESILKASERAKDLVQQILTFSRQVESDPQPIRLDSIIKETMQLLRPSIPSTIVIKQDIEKDCDKVMADGTQIHQIIMNLCTNAYHAMAKKGGELGIGLKQIAIDERTAELNINLKPGKYVQLSISDTGIGMEEQTLEYIFEPFFTTKKVGEGTGLGLSVVHGIVNSYNGDIVVYSEPGKGSVFRIYLPVLKNQKTKTAQKKKSKLKTGNERILIVDDEIEIIQMLKLMLESLGYSVVEKTDSLEALKIFIEQKDNFDLIITDLTMPNLSGLNLAREVQQIKNDMPIIVTTGFADPVSKEIKAQYNIKALLTKPIMNEDLAEAIRSALD